MANVISARRAPGGRRVPRRLSPATVFRPASPTLASRPLPPSLCFSVTLSSAIQAPAGPEELSTRQTARVLLPTSPGHCRSAGPCPHFALLEEVAEYVPCTCAKREVRTWSGRAGPIDTEPCRLGRSCGDCVPHPARGFSVPGVAAVHSYYTSHRDGDCRPNRAASTRVR